MSEPTESHEPQQVRKPVSDLLQKTAEEVRRQPVKSLVWAFFVGVFLTVFPIGRIVGLLLSVAFGLLRPVLLVLGLLKVCEALGEKRK